MEPAIMTGYPPIKLGIDSNDMISHIWMGGSSRNIILNNEDGFSLSEGNFKLFKRDDNDYVGQTLHLGHSGEASWKDKMKMTIGNLSISSAEGYDDNDYAKFSQDDVSVTKEGHEVYLARRLAWNHMVSQLYFTRPPYYGRIPNLRNPPVIYEFVKNIQGHDDDVHSAASWKELGRPPLIKSVFVKTETNTDDDGPTIKAYIEGEGPVWGLNNEDAGEVRIDMRRYMDHIDVDERHEDCKERKFDKYPRMMDETVIALGGQVVGGVMANAFSSSSSSWDVYAVECATVLGLSFSLAGMSLRGKKRALSAAMTKIGSMATASAIIVALGSHLPPAMAWTVGPVAISTIAVGVFFA